MSTWQPVSLQAGSTQERSWKRVRFSPNGQLLATFTEVTRITGFVGTQVRVWTGGSLQPAGGPYKVDYLSADSAVAFSPDGRFLLAGTDHDVFLCHTSSPTPAFRKVKDLNGTVGKVSFSPDGRLLAAQRITKGDVCVLDAATQQPVTQLTRDRDLTQVEFSPTGPMLATSIAKAGSGSLDLWFLGAVPTPGRVHLGSFDTPVADLRFSPDGTFIAAVGHPGRQLGKQVPARLWHVQSAQPGGPLPLPGPTTISFSPDSRFLAASCADQAIRLLDLRSQSPVSVLPGSNATFAPSARLLATTEPAGLRLWTLPA
jgi:WD40 repeat protein